MRDEKKYIVEEVSRHLGKSPYVFLTDYQRVNVTEIAELRKSLSQVGAEFHVVKNSALIHAATERNLPNLGEVTGPTAIIIGGKNPSEVAKILIKFHKEKDEKCAVKLGVLGDKVMSNAEVRELSKLPGLEVLRAQFLGLLNTPAQQMVRVLVATPEGLLNVLNAKSKQS